MVNRAVLLLRRFIGGSPRQTFVVFPLLTFVFELLRRRGTPRLDTRFLPLLAWGYLQYRLCGQYRQLLGAGSRGMERLPDRLITTGPYALCRNPMYLGHIIFTVGLIAVFRSPLAVALLLNRMARFSRQVRMDEERLERAFGEEYRAYRARVRRWVPGLF